MTHTTDKCYNCGADYGLHQAATGHCPRHGIEEIRYDKLSSKYFPQRWENTVFEDSGIRKLNEAAPELLKALIDVANMCKDHLIHDLEFNPVEIMENVEEAIKKATV